MCWWAYDFLNRDTHVGIFIILPLGSSDGIYLVKNERTQIGSLISTENVLLVNINLVTL